MTTSASTSLSDDEELLFRQVHPSFVRDGAKGARLARKAVERGRLHPPNARQAPPGELGTLAST